jgi:hypothetical protein
MNIINKPQPHGFIPDEIQEEDYVLGDGNLQGEILQDTGQWAMFLPKEEIQYRKGLETSNCTAYATLNCIEIIHKKRYGCETNYSERFTGILAGTYPPGNSPHKVAESIRKGGVVLEEKLPFSDDIKTIEQYYNPNPLPDELLETGRGWWKFWYTFKHEYVFRSTTPLSEKKKRLMEALKYSPLGVSVYAWAEDGSGKYVKFGSDNHWTVLFGYQENEAWLVFDSYDKTIKRLHWDYDFGFAKRYHLVKKNGEVRKETPYEKLRRIFKIFI